MKRIIFTLILLWSIWTVKAQILYGTTSLGGSEGGGVITKYDLSTNTLSILANFNSDAKNPVANLLQASDGKFYGMTIYGGANYGGVLFSYDPIALSYTILKSLTPTEGYMPYGSLTQAKDGKLYGLTSAGGNNSGGVIFSFDPITQTFTKLKDFISTDGINPRGDLIQAKDNKLYGMTIAGGNNNSGVIFSFDPTTLTYTKLRDLEVTDGTNPKGSLIEAKDGKLYGMTYSGGLYNKGTVFSFDPSNSAFIKLKDFNGTDGGGPNGSLLQATNGLLYGMTTEGGSNSAGNLFSIEPTTSSYTNIQNFNNSGGARPFGSLLQDEDGKLYGMTSTGGIYGYGTIFMFDPSNSIYSKIFDFELSKGSSPTGSLIKSSNGKMYGMTQGGGQAEWGVLFSFIPSSTYYTIEKLFGPNFTGTNPYGGVVQASDGKLYGTTGAGGSFGLGVIYSYDPANNILTNLKNFSATDGTAPTGTLLKASNGKLYGTTSRGGINNLGVLFSFDPSNLSYTKIKDFSTIDGSRPHEGLMQASDGKLYGMTTGGGAKNSGVIYSFDPSTNIYTKIKEFDYTNGDGYGAQGRLTQAVDGKLYGLNYSGGLNNAGTIFSIDLVTMSFNKIKDFNSTDGMAPTGDLIQAADGKLFGMTSWGGAYGSGVLFSIDPLTKTYTNLKDFAPADGDFPQGSLMQSSNGKLYGVAQFGGVGNNGTTFSFDPYTSTFTVLSYFLEFNGRNPASVRLVESGVPSTLPTPVISSWGSNPISGATTNRVWVERNQPGQFVTRHYQITPENNPSTSTGRVTLSFTNMDFKNFNNQNPAPQLLLPDIDDPSTIEARKANLLIEKRSGISADGTGLPNSYTGTIETIDPEDADIIWNSIGMNWQVSFNVNGFSGFFVKTTTGALPVAIASFTVIAQTDKILLQWSTTTEVNSKDFTIERSFDGSHFENIGTVAASGNSNVKRDYTFSDWRMNEIMSRVVFYRIKETDLDGKVIYSEVRKVNIPAGNNQFILLYNPVRNEALFNYSGSERKQVTIRVIDHLGRVVLTRLQTVEAGNNQIRLSTTTLAQGIYEVELRSNNEQHIVRMAKE